MIGNNTIHINENNNNINERNIANIKVLERKNLKIFMMLLLI